MRRNDYHFTPTEARRAHIFCSVGGLRFRPARTQTISDAQPLTIHLQAAEFNQAAATGYYPEANISAVTFPFGCALDQYPKVKPELHAAFPAATLISKIFGTYLKDLPCEKHLAKGRCTRRGDIASKHAAHACQPLEPVSEASFSFAGLTFDLRNGAGVFGFIFKVSHPFETCAPLRCRKADKSVIPARFEKWRHAFRSAKVDGVADSGRSASGWLTSTSMLVEIQMNLGNVDEIKSGHDISIETDIVKRTLGLPSLSRTAASSQLEKPQGSMAGVRFTKTRIQRLQFSFRGKKYISFVRQDEFASCDPAACKPADKSGRHLRHACPAVASAGIFCKAKSEANFPTGKTLKVGANDSKHKLQFSQKGSQTCDVARTADKKSTPRDNFEVFTPFLFFINLEWEGKPLGKSICTRVHTAGVVLKANPANICAAKATPANGAKDQCAIHRTITEQLAAARVGQLGEVWPRTKSPHGVVTERVVCRATSEQLAEIVKAANKITEGNR